jgi:hypothetical protein
LTFVSYQDELKQIWRDNFAATKSAVLTEEVEEANASDSVLMCVRNNHSCKGYVNTGLAKLVCVCYCHNHQFITKIPECNSSCTSKRRTKTGGA